MTVCQPLFTQGMTCQKTFDCAQGLICWPLTVKDAVNSNLTCQPAFSLPSYTMIGFMPNSSMTPYQNALNAGYLCTSGIAAKINSTAALCVTIAKVTTNLDNYVSSQALPYYCDLNQVYSSPQGCNYMYKTSTGAYASIFQDYCQCAMDNSVNSTLTANNVGICPLPGQA